MADDITVMLSGGELLDECDSLIVASRVTNLWEFKEGISAIASTYGLTLNRDFETHRCELVNRPPIFAE